MRHSPLWMSSLPLALACAALCACTGCDDEVLLQNTSGAPIGLLVDGHRSTGDVVLQSYVGPVGAYLLEVGTNSASTVSNQIIAYTEHRPPVWMRGVAWTTSADAITMTFPPERTVPLKIHIIDERDCDMVRVANDIAYLQDMLDRERVGLTVSAPAADITTDGHFFSHPDTFDESSAADVTAAKRAGYDEHAINVYYVYSVGGQPEVSETPNYDNCLFIGSLCNSSILAHEFGHACSLRHSNLVMPAAFDESNLMHMTNDPHGYLTEGQTFRMHYNIHSSLVTHLGFNASSASTLPFENVIPSPGSGCPPIQKRIWADGTWPPN